MILTQMLLFVIVAEGEPNLFLNSNISFSVTPVRTVSFDQLEYWFIIYSIYLLKLIIGYELSYWLSYIYSVNLNFRSLSFAINSDILEAFHLILESYVRIQINPLQHLIFTTSHVLFISGRYQQQPVFIGFLLSVELVSLFPKKTRLLCSRTALLNLLMPQAFAIAFNNGVLNLKALLLRP